MKTDKELAVDLAAAFLQGVYSSGTLKPITHDGLKLLVSAAYDAIKALPSE